MEFFVLRVGLFFELPNERRGGGAIDKEAVLAHSMGQAAALHCFGGTFPPIPGSTQISSNLTFGEGLYFGAEHSLCLRRSPGELWVSPHHSRFCRWRVLEWRPQLVTWKARKLMPVRTDPQGPDSR